MWCVQLNANSPIFSLAFAEEGGGGGGGGGPDGFSNMENMFAGLNTSSAKPTFDDLDDEQEDSDDEELPNLE